MGSLIDLKGKVFGRLTVLSFVGTIPKRGAFWNCLCVCGKNVSVASCHLISGHTKGCGCFRPSKDPAERFWKKVDKTVLCPVPGLKGNCWIWTAGKTTFGYGAFAITKSETLHAHTFSLRLAGRPEPPAGYEPDHLCRVPACVNPDHLEIVSHQINVLRGKGPCAKNSIKTRCKRGHDLSGENLKETIDSRGRRSRRCRTCIKMAMERWHQQHPGYKQAYNAAYKRRRK